VGPPAAGRKSEAALRLPGSGLLAAAAAAEAPWSCNLCPPAALRAKLEDLRKECVREGLLGGGGGSGLQAVVASSDEAGEANELRRKLEEETALRRQLQQDMEVLHMEKAECRVAAQLGTEASELRRELREECSEVFRARRAEGGAAARLGAEVGASNPVSELRHELQEERSEATRLRRELRKAAAELRKAAASRSTSAWKAMVLLLLRCTAPESAVVTGVIGAIVSDSRARRAEQRARLAARTRMPYGWPEEG